MSDDETKSRLDRIEGEGAVRSPRPWLQVMFVCANAYQKVHRSADGSTYQARCPRCGKQVRFAVGPGGTNQRMFQVSC